VRHQLLAALGHFGDRELTHAAMDLTLGNEFELREAMPLIWGATGRPATQPVAYEFVKRNFDALVDKLPRDAGAMLPFVGVALCDEQAQRDVESFFKDRSSRFTGGPRMLSQALERMRLCIAFRKAQTPSIAAFFSAKKP
jgi:alanyl aminopeptidase